MSAQAVAPVTWSQISSRRWVDFAAFSLKLRSLLNEDEMSLRIKKEVSCLKFDFLGLSNLK